jgi:hypothetical protein
VRFATDSGFFNSVKPKKKYEVPEISHESPRSGFLSIWLQMRAGSDLKQFRQKFWLIMKSRSRNLEFLVVYHGRSCTVRFLSFSVRCATGKGEGTGASRPSKDVGLYCFWFLALYLQQRERSRAYPVDCLRHSIFERVFVLMQRISESYQEISHLSI